MASKAADCTIRDAVEILARGYRVDARGRRSRHVRGPDRRAFADLDAREVYSYGRHFPLFRFVPREGRRPPLFVVNGDAWRGGFSATSSHQAIAREAIAATGLRLIVLPFSALAGAGIEVDSVWPVHVRDDLTWTEYLELADDAPDLDDLASADTFAEHDDRQEHSGYVAGTWRREYVWRRASGRYTRTIYRRAHVTTSERTAAGYVVGSWRESDSWAEPVSEHAYRDGNTQLERGADGVWRGRHWRHRLGDALFCAVRRETITRAPDPGELGAEGTGSGDRAVWSTYCRQAPAVPDGGPAVSAPHLAGSDGHCVFCGDRLRVRETIARRARYLSSFDTNEFPPLYFLAEVPRGAGETVESALDSLAPRAVHAAIARGRDVLRQGDVFFVATELDDATVYARARARARLTQWTRGARARAGEVGYRPPLTAAQQRVFRAYRRRLWRETWREAVRAATAHERPRAQPSGRGTERDAYRRLYGANALASWHRADADARVLYLPDVDVATRERIRDVLAIYTTAHTATEVVRAHRGAAYVRGTVRHVPELERGRQGGRDHRALKLGDGATWYLAIRNRVPRQDPRRRGRRRSTAGTTPAER